MTTTTKRDSAIEHLAKQLFWKMEHLDPVTETGEWEDLNEQDKEFHRACIGWLLLHREEILAALEVD